MPVTSEKRMSPSRVAFARTWDAHAAVRHTVANLRAMPEVNPGQDRVLQLEASTVVVTTPFLVVAERRNDSVRVKYRTSDWS